MLMIPQVGEPEGGRSGRPLGRGQGGENQWQGAQRRRRGCVRGDAAAMVGKQLS